MRVLIAGLGGIGQRHVRNLRSLLGRDVEILAYRVRNLQHVVTPELNADRARSVEAEYGIRAFDDLDQALAQSPNIAFVTNPSSLHVPTATACARAGCDLFIEKPVSDSLEGTAALADIVDERRLIAMVGYQLRFHPCFERLADIVRSGVLGNIVSVRATIGEYLANWHPYEDYRGMYAARADLGGGVVLSQIHELDYLFALFGMPRRLFSVGGRWSDLEIDVEDTASTLMECSIDGRALPIHLNQDYVQRPPTRRCDVVGDKGRVELDFVRLTVSLHRGDGSAVEEYSAAGFDRNELFVRELQHFLRCVEERVRPVVDLHAGLQSLRMALAVKESIESGKVVELNGRGTSHAG